MDESLPAGILYIHHIIFFLSGAITEEFPFKLSTVCICVCLQDSAESVAHGLARKFPRHLGPKVVRQEQLTGLIIKLQDRLRTASAMGEFRNNRKL